MWPEVEGEAVDMEDPEKHCVGFDDVWKILIVGSRVFEKWSMEISRRIQPNFRAAR